MDTSIKVSVIIPVYKVESYIHQCVDSVLGQTYPNLEVILVDDGSPDRCPEICDEYAEKDSRVTVIHKKNGGSSDARNAGISKAAGDYVVFMDSDDYWTSPSGLSLLTERLSETHADVLSFAYDKLEEDTGKETPMLQNSPSMQTGIRTKEAQLDFLTQNGLYIASACNKLIQKEIIKQVPFEVGKITEDVEWAARLMATAKSFDFLNVCFYCYRQRSGSKSHSLSQNSCDHLKDAIMGCCEVWRQCEEDAKEYIGRYAAYQFSTFIAVQALVPVFPRQTISQLKNNADILRYYGSSKKVKYMYYGVKLFGLMLWCRVIRMTRFIWNTRRDKI